MKLIAKNTHNSLDSKRIPTSPRYDIPAQNSPSHRLKRDKLIKLKDRLEKVNFDCVLTDLRKYKPVYRR